MGTKYWLGFRPGRTPITWILRPILFTGLAARHTCWLDPGRETVLSATVQLWDSKNDLEAFVDQRELAWDASGISILSEERIILAGNQPAAQFTVQGSDGTQAFFLLTTNGESYLVFSGNGDLSLLAEIAHTIRPIS